VLLLIQIDKEGTASPLFYYTSFMVSNEHLRALVEQSLTDQSQYLVDLMVNAKSTPVKITVVLDGDTGISIDDCAHVSRALSKALDAENTLENFALEVSTPGVDQPLKLKRQYLKNIGRELKIQLKDKRIERGKLVETTADAIVVEHEVKEGKKKERKKTVFTFQEIERTIVEVSFK
jgi:ribosome maturation factor RimP